MNTRPIVAAVDVLERSRAAAGCAAWLARALRAPLELVFVLDAGGLPALPRVGPAADPVRLNELQAVQEADARIRAALQLETLAAELRNNGPVRHAVLDGQPATVLRTVAGERRAVLLVTGTAARKGVEHVLQGSVSGRLAATAPCPVVTVPPGAAVGEMGPVVVGDDGSDHGRRAASHAAALAERLGRDLVRFHVQDGDPVEVIRAAAHEKHACLVVTGTRGRGPVRTELFGSVSTGLVQMAGRPVALVPESAGEPVSEPG